MSVDRNISLLKMKQELKRVAPYANESGWLISQIDESNLSFTVTMTSPIDKQTYIVEFICTDYPFLPPIIDFIDSKSGTKGIRTAYPQNSDSFFHGNGPCICNPCSRKSYRSFVSTGPHPDWNLADWRLNPKIGTLTALDSMLMTIFLRISSKNYYRGRMI